MTAFNDPAATHEQRSGGIAHEAGELHRLLIESVQDYAIFALDPDGYILSWNAGAQRFKGYAPEEVIGRHFSIFYPPDRVSQGWPAHALREADRLGRFEDEGWRVRSDGTRFWANVVITALRAEDGRLLGYAKVTRDLTHRRAAEEALRLSEERFRLLVTSVKDYAIFMLDPEGRVATWNEGAERAKGYTADEIIGRHFSIFYPPERVAEHFPEYELEQAARIGRFEDEGWRIRKDGSRFWANVVITPLYDDAGSLVGYGKVTRDLTERRANEQRALEDAGRVAAEEAARRVADATRERIQQLQQLTSRLAAVHTIAEIERIIFEEAFPMLHVSAGSIGVVDPAQRLLHVVADVGYESLGDPYRAVPLDADLPMARAVAEARPIVFLTRDERDALCPSTRDLLHPFDESVVFPLMHGGRAMGALAMHRRTIAERLTPLTDETLQFMESVAQQCGQALERAALYDSERRARQEAEAARARAEEANRAKGEFLASMSHELRTPLNAIGGYAQLLEMGIGGDVSDEQRIHLARIQRSQQHLLGLINDILNFARVDAGQVDYELEAVPMRDVLEAVMVMIVPQATTKGLELRIEECNPALTVWADRSKVEQVVLNLLSNAVKFTDAGGRVSVGCSRASAGSILCAVSDTGSGIPEDQLERIFEPFVQVGRSLRATHEGTGLGLAISRDLARAMGGDITVRSVVGEGSTFCLVLPDAVARDAAPG